MSLTLKGEKHSRYGKSVIHVRPFFTMYVCMLVVEICPTSFRCNALPCSVQNLWRGPVQSQLIMFIASCVEIKRGRLLQHVQWINKVERLQHTEFSVRTRQPVGGNGEYVVAHKKVLSLTSSITHSLIPGPFCCALSWYGRRP